MNVLVLHQKDPKDADATASTLSEAGHTPQRASATSVLKGSGRIAPVDVVIVFSEIYKENETYAACRRLREIETLRETPLLVAVNMYQMPLANRVKAMPNAHFIFTPIDAEDLQGRVQMLAHKTEEQPEQQR
jgi:response regulator RpfG family c-di-GMP phosphodiesterase